MDSTDWLTNSTVTDLRRKPCRSCSGPVRFGWDEGQLDLPAEAGRLARKTERRHISERDALVDVQDALDELYRVVEDPGGPVSAPEDFLKYIEVLWSRPVPAGGGLGQDPPGAGADRADRGDGRRPRAVRIPGHRPRPGEAVDRAIWGGPREDRRSAATPVRPHLTGSRRSPTTCGNDRAQGGDAGVGRRVRPDRTVSASWTSTRAPMGPGPPGRPWPRGPRRVRCSRTAPATAVSLSGLKTL